MDEKTTQIWADAYEKAARLRAAQIAALSDVIEVTVTETVTYRHSYTRAELAGLLVKAGWTAHSLEPLSTTELAQLVADERPGTVEDDLQPYGDVQGAEWRAGHIVTGSTENGDEK